MTGLRIRFFFFFLPFGEAGVGGDDDFGLVASDGDGITESSSFAPDFDALLEEFFE